MRRRVESLLQTSKRELLNCCLRNGAIVAADSRKPYYPKGAKDYFYVWPRDASYTCLALDCLGAEGPQDRFFRWCLKAEKFKGLGLLLEKYKINGKFASHDCELEEATGWGNHFQPDQTGTVLLAVWNHYRDDSENALKHSKLIKSCANGLCRYWDKTHFSVVAQDLWEERLAFPDMRDSFTYSLAACARGLECAYEILGDGNWLNVSNQMKRQLNKHYDNYFFRSHGKMPEKRIDASLLGLVYPFQICDAKDKRIRDTVREIEKRLVADCGVHRYENDEYDGWMYKGLQRKKGAGFWPLLNLWMSIVLKRMGREKDALKYYGKVVDSVDQYIPEQIFENKIQKSPSPLCWGHAMFVLASRELGANGTEL